VIGESFFAELEGGLEFAGIGEADTFDLS